MEEQRRQRAREESNAGLGIGIEEGGGVIREEWSVVDGCSSARGGEVQ